MWIYLHQLGRFIQVYVAFYTIDCIKSSSFTVINMKKVSASLLVIITNSISTIKLFNL